MMKQKKQRAIMKKASGKKKVIFAEYFSFVGGGQAVLINLIKGLRKEYEAEVLLMQEGPFEKLLKEIFQNYLKAPVELSLTSEKVESFDLREVDQERIEKNQKAAL